MGKALELHLGRPCEPGPRRHGRAWQVQALDLPDPFLWVALLLHPQEHDARNKEHAGTHQKHVPQRPVWEVVVHRLPRATGVLDWVYVVTCNKAQKDQEQKERGRDDQAEAKPGVPAQGWGNCTVYGWIWLEPEGSDIFVFGFVLVLGHIGFDLQLSSWDQVWDRGRGANGKQEVKDSKVRGFLECAN